MVKFIRTFSVVVYKCVLLDSDDRFRGHFLYSNTRDINTRILRPVATPSDQGSA